MIRAPRPSILGRRQDRFDLRTREEANQRLDEANAGRQVHIISEAFAWDPSGGAALVRALPDGLVGAGGQRKFSFSDGLHI
jgi:hypothetical protein